MKDKSKNKNLFVTKPLTPLLTELIPYFEKIMETGCLTNGGIFHREFEMELCKYLGVKHISLFSSGTMALTIALKALDLKGEVITPSFTHVSTTQAIYWNNLKPVFVDIDATDLNIDISEIEKAITKDTCAILAVHMFGHPCKFAEINNIAQKYNLKVIYDAAHCFGVEVNGSSICNNGDLSVLSFHATKVFNCIEGGAIVCKDEAMKNYIDALKNSGMNSKGELVGYGLNAKLNEVQAAWGLAGLKYVDGAIEKRKRSTMKYRELLSKVRGISFFSEDSFVKYNYSYFPVIIDQEVFGSDVETLIFHLENYGVFPKRYFYPLVSEFKQFSIYKRHDLKVSENCSKNILCLPLSHETSFQEVQYIVDLIKQVYMKRKQNKISNSIG